MDIKSYWKAYHSKNRDKINASRRQAYAERNRDAESIIKRCEILNKIESCVEVVTTPKPVDPPKSTSAGKCVYCWSTETTLKTINGGPYPVCLKHQNK